MEESWKCKEGRRMGYCPFSFFCCDREFSIATKIADFMLRHWDFCHDNGTSITTGLGISRASWSRPGSVCRNSAARMAVLVRMTTASLARATRRYPHGNVLLLRQSFSVTTELSSSSLHYVVHCLSYCSFAHFMGTRHGHCSHGVSKPGFRSSGTQNKKKK